MIKLNWMLLIICIWVIGGVAYFIVFFHDNSTEMDKTNKEIINDMNCYNYGYWLHDREGDWLQLGSDKIREKAQQVQMECQHK